jgi:hypothetical protein
MENVGVVLELMVNEKDYVFDTFLLDKDRLVNNIIDTKKVYGKDLETRNSNMLSDLRANYKNLHSEEHRTILLNYLACMEWVWDAITEFKDQSMGIYIMIKLPQKKEGTMNKTMIEYATMNWMKFEEFQKELPPVYFKD